jgi:hypothetical protein
VTSQLAQVSATGDIATASAYLRGVTLTGGSDAATLVVRSGGSGGTPVLTLKAPANSTVVLPLPGAFCSGGIHATFTGTGPVASFCWE